jgi:hypothetical protein
MLRTSRRLALEVGMIAPALRAHFSLLVDDTTVNCTSGKSKRFFANTIAEIYRMALLGAWCSGR